MRDEESIFAEAVRQRSARERGEFLDRARGDDPDVRQSVETLLAAHANAQGILELTPSPA